MHRVGLAVALIMIATVCVAQEPGGSQAGTAASVGEKTVVGCIGIGAPRGFVLNTSDGRALTLYTDRDLSSFVGKQVQIRTRYQRTGLSVVASEEAMTGTTESDAAKANPAPDTQAFAGSLSLSFTGKVLGPCPTGK